MPYIQIVFYLFAGLTIASALVVLWTKNVLYAAFSLIVTFLGVAAMYVFAGADFIAVAQILIYVGGILVLIIFGVMLTNRLSGQSVTTESHNKFTGYLIGLTIFGTLFYAIYKVNFTAIGSVNDGSGLAGESTVGLIGVKLMSTYMLPFEIIAVLLLLTLIGAAFIAGRQMQK